MKISRFIEICACVIGYILAWQHHVAQMVFGQKYYVLVHASNYKTCINKTSKGRKVEIRLVHVHSYTIHYRVSLRQRNIVVIHRPDKNKVTRKEMDSAD